MVEFRGQKHTRSRRLRVIRNPDLFEYQLARDFLIAGRYNQQQWTLQWLRVKVAVAVMEVRIGEAALQSLESRLAHNIQRVPPRARMVSEHERLCLRAPHWRLECIAEECSGHSGR